MNDYIRPRPKHWAAQVAQAFFRLWLAAFISMMLCYLWQTRP